MGLRSTARYVTSEKYVKPHIRTQLPEQEKNLIHLDICGPMSTLSLRVSKYFATFIDDHTKCTDFWFNHFMLANGSISWEAKKQKSVALSTMEAEYTSLSEIAKETIYLRRLLKHMDFYDLVKDATARKKKIRCKMLFL